MDVVRSACFDMNRHAEKRLQNFDVSARVLGKVQGAKLTAAASEMSADSLPNRSLIRRPFTGLRSCSSGKIIHVIVVGDRYALVARQRVAVARCTCGDEAVQRRQRRQDPSSRSSRTRALDRHNVNTLCSQVRSSAGFLYSAFPYPWGCDWCQRQAVSTIESISGNSGFQSSVFCASELSATSSGGSPGRRGPILAGIG